MITQRLSAVQLKLVDVGLPVDEWTMWTMLRGRGVKSWGIDIGKYSTLPFFLKKVRL